jgi:hypothetical protein
MNPVGQLRGTPNPLPPLLNEIWIGVQRVAPEPEMISLLAKYAEYVLVVLVISIVAELDSWIG